MTRLSWIRNVFARTVTRRLREAPHRARPALESLEDRTVPSTFTVTNTLDDGSIGSLRWAVGQANATAEANTINFDPIDFATSKTITLGGTQLELSDTTGTQTIMGPAAGVTISGNNASRVFQIDPSVSASISGLTITGGNAAISSGVGGGVLSFGTLAMTNCTVTDNSALPGGGGLFNNGPLTLTNSIVSGNSATSTGGGLSAGGTTTVTDCTISDNAAANGGGVFGQYGYGHGNTTLTNCTVSDNSASLGGGLFNGRKMTIGNTIVARNTASHSESSDLWGGPVTDLGHNLFGAALSGFEAGAGDVFTDAPLLAPLGNYGDPIQTMPLLPGSPAIDAGDPALAPAADERGMGRVGAPDIGAFESSGFTIAVSSGSGRTTNLSTAFSAPLIVLVIPNNPNEPVAGGQVTFTPPSSGASAIISGSPATIDAAGNASVTATANGTPGSYAVSAAASGITAPASFGLANGLTISVPPAQTAYQNVDLAVGGISIGDAPGAILTVTVGANHGTLTLGTANGLTVTGNGTGSVTLVGSTANVNAALVTLVYRGAPNYSGGDTLSIAAADGAVSATPASVAINVVSVGQQAANLQAQVSALQTAGVLNSGQANSLIVKLNLKGNNGDAGKVQAFLNQVTSFVQGGILTQGQADCLLYWGNFLLLGVSRQ